MTDFSQFPKIELHLHLDCCLSYDAVKELKAGVSTEQYYRDFVAPAKCTNLAHYLKTTVNSVALMQTEAALRLTVRDLFQQLQRDNVLYAEMRFAPLLHLQQGLTPEQVVRIVDDETAKCMTQTGVETRLILCTLRHFSHEQSMETVKLVEAFQGTRVVALDIAGDEAGFPVDAHVGAFRYAIEHNLPRIAHAGEARGADSVWETLEHFKPSRVGHGVRSIEDASLIEHLAKTRIHMEVCPKCNVQTDIVPTYADHPVDRLYQSGISMGISTDTRAITDVTLNEEYGQLNAVFGWGRAHFLACNQNALQATFAPPELKAQFAKALETTYQSS